eukprot:gnl/TRDRNA2_/TRDRNA2_145446_c0_seq1.p1 gnl/TRDRNA2_/TRDRNA2_145446_c0~~gnl/TRDRNA2_/TRDRNA2_145446_c0_seq1.p1  ORF type:complete len:267 (+),score=35.25 gnl/TRDRNA2_/TRDRNA2_145446_c0_seq1:38-838(+)
MRSLIDRIVTVLLVILQANHASGRQEQLVDRALKSSDLCRVQLDNALLTKSPPVFTRRLAMTNVRWAAPACGYRCQPRACAVSAVRAAPAIRAPLVEHAAVVGHVYRAPLTTMRALKKPVMPWTKKRGSGSKVRRGRKKEKVRPSTGSARPREMLESGGAAGTSDPAFDVDAFGNSEAASDDVGEPIDLESLAKEKEYMDELLSLGVGADEEPEEPISEERARDRAEQAYAALAEFDSKMERRKKKVKQTAKLRKDPLYRRAKGLS